ncbi:hypothetical protein G6O67_006643 [Ophiocordyceps sinensis]|uniref:Major facilitator superfamily domain, general substrate transporter n=1 Tax=Ophiocordyceps sinensis TaxID=72228 RepID=A0A8H4PN55_9HYPO|nr:hypothetical protein G6O67_006643 [Ophiocordyceps sinensis]
MEPATRPRRYGATDSSASEVPMSPVPGEADRYLPVAIIFLMLIIDGLGFAVALAPQTRLFEDIVCRQYYSRNAGDALGLAREDGCKISAVQDVVAQLFGWQTFFDGIPGLVLAMYFGVLADTRGRSAVLFWSMAGQLLGMSWLLMICWLELPLQLTWLSSLFLVIGGGGTVTSAVSMMVLTDSTSEDNRSRVFFLGQAVLIVSEIIGPALSSATMEKSLWLPLSIALACTVTTTVLAGVMPETLPHGRDNRPLDPDYVRKPGHVERGLRGRLSVIWRHTSSTLGFIISHSSILYLVVTFLVVDYSRQSLGILLQYISLRYSVSISRANLVLSFKAFAQLATFALVLPAVDAFVVKHLRVSAESKDLWLSRLSVGLLAIGFAVLVLAPSLPLVFVALVIYTLGIMSV